MADTRGLEVLRKKLADLWLQRSWISLLREGDQNTKFFHRKAVWRARQNRIKILKMANDEWGTKEEDMQLMATDYFQTLYKKDPTISLDCLLPLIHSRVDGDKNNALCKEFIDEEISNALFQIGSQKTPGPDGFPACFFQYNWEVFRDDICVVVCRIKDN